MFAVFWSHYPTLRQEAAQQAGIRLQAAAPKARELRAAIWRQVSDSASRLLSSCLNLAAAGAVVWLVSLWSFLARHVNFFFIFFSLYPLFLFACWQLVKGISQGYDSICLFFFDAFVDVKVSMPLLSKRRQERCRSNTRNGKHGDRMRKQRAVSVCSYMLVRLYSDHFLVWMWRFDDCLCLLGMVILQPHLELVENRGWQSFFQAGPVYIRLGLHFLSPPSSWGL